MSQLVQKVPVQTQHNIMDTALAAFLEIQTVLNHSMVFTYHFDVKVHDKHDTAMEMLLLILAFPC